MSPNPENPALDTQRRVAEVGRLLDQGDQDSAFTVARGLYQEGCRDPALGAHLLELARRDWARVTLLDHDRLARLFEAATSAGELRPGDPQAEALALRAGLLLAGDFASDQTRYYPLKALERLNDVITREGPPPAAGFLAARLAELGLSTDLVAAPRFFVPPPGAGEPDPADQRDLKFLHRARVLNLLARGLVPAPPGGRPGARAVADRVFRWVVEQVVLEPESPAPLERTTFPIGRLIAGTATPAEAAWLFLTLLEQLDLPAFLVAEDVVGAGKGALPRAPTAARDADDANAAPGAAAPPTDAFRGLAAVLLGPGQWVYYDLARGVPLPAPVEPGAADDPAVTAAHAGLARSRALYWASDPLMLADRMGVVDRLVNLRADGGDERRRLLTPRYRRPLEREFALLFGAERAPVVPATGADGLSLDLWPHPFERQQWLDERRARGAEPPGDPLERLLFLTRNLHLGFLPGRHPREALAAYELLLDEGRLPAALRPRGAADEAGSDALDDQARGALRARVQWFRALAADWNRDWARAFDALAAACELAAPDTPLGRAARLKTADLLAQHGRDWAWAEARRAVDGGLASANEAAAARARLRALLGDEVEPVLDRLAEAARRAADGALVPSELAARRDEAQQALAARAAARGRELLHAIAAESAPHRGVRARWLLEGRLALGDDDGP